MCKKVDRAKTCKELGFTKNLGKIIACGKEKNQHKRVLTLYCTLLFLNVFALIPFCLIHLVFSVFYTISVLAICQTNFDDFFCFLQLIPTKMIETKNRSFTRFLTFFIGNTLNFILVKYTTKSSFESNCNVIKN